MAVIFPCSLRVLFKHRLTSSVRTSSLISANFSYTTQSADRALSFVRYTKPGYDAWWRFANEQVIPATGPQGVREALRLDPCSTIVRSKQGEFGLVGWVSRAPESATVTQNTLFPGTGACRAMSDQNCMVHGGNQRCALSGVGGSIDGDQGNSQSICNSHYCTGGRTGPGLDRMQKPKHVALNEAEMFWLAPKCV